MVINPYRKNFPFFTPLNLNISYAGYRSIKKKPPEKRRRVFLLEEQVFWTHLKGNLLF
jgi:hypothetical protein